MDLPIVYPAGKRTGVPWAGAGAAAGLDVSWPSVACKYAWQTRTQKLALHGHPARKPSLAVSPVLSALMERAEGRSQAALGILAFWGILGRAHEW